MNHRGSRSVTQAAILIEIASIIEIRRNTVHRPPFHYTRAHTSFKITAQNYIQISHALTHPSYVIFVWLRKYKKCGNRKMPGASLASANNPPASIHTMPPKLHSQRRTLQFRYINWQTHVICIVVWAAATFKFTSFFFFVRTKQPNYYQFSCVFFLFCCHRQQQQQ